MTPLQQAATALMDAMVQTDFTCRLGEQLDALEKALEAEQAQAVEPVTVERAKLIARLNDYGNMTRNDVHNAIDMLEADSKAQQVAVPVPLTEDEIFDLWRDGDIAGGAAEFEDTVRAVEAHHKIGAKP